MSARLCGSTPHGALGLADALASPRGRSPAPDRWVPGLTGDPCRRDAGDADLLREGPRASDELAEATDTVAPTLYRLLRALASVGVLREEDGRLFTLTPLGEQLRTDHPQSLHGWAAFVGRPYFWGAWAELLHSVRTGENAFRHVYGTDVWSYRAEHPEESAIFDRAMTSLTSSQDRALVETYDFGRFATVVDVGGGDGTLLAALLTFYPAMQGILVDQPHVVAAAEAVMSRAEVADRCRVVGGSFFDAVPAGGNAYVLKSIIHNWDDDQATAILGVCRRAIREDGALLLLERIVGAPNEDPVTKFMDLTMLVAPGGRERTLAEFEALFTAVGFRLHDVTPTPDGLTVIEGIPV